MSLLFRAFYAPMASALVSPSGMPTKAVYIFIRTLLKTLKEHPPAYLGVAFDLAAPTFRDKLFEEYKSNRPAMPDDLRVQVPYVRQFCEALGLPLVEREGYEADDVMGTLAKEGTERGLDVFIVSGDEDLFQLVNQQVRVLKPSRGGGEEETLCDEEKVREVLGVEPGRVVDWLALTGDPSDNIPGARPLPGQEPPLPPGAKKRSYIGPKGATELLQRFGTLEDALKNYDKVERQSYREALRDYANEARLSRDLATIRRDVPLETDVGGLKPRPRDLERLTRLCQELGFSSLLREFLAEAPAAAEAGVETLELSSREAAEAWLEPIEAGADLAIAFGVEGEESFAGRLAGLAFSDGRRVASLSAAAFHDLLPAVRPVLVDSKRSKIVHNSKLLAVLLGKVETKLAGVRDDVMLYSYLLDPLATTHALEDIALRRLGRKLAASLGEVALRTAELARMLRPEVEREGLEALYREIELPLSPVLADLETAGVRIDPKILAAMSAEFERELTELTREIYDLAGGAFDIDSPKQLGEILFEKLKLPGGKRLRKSGQYSTEAAVLESLAERHELPRKIIEYRTRAKLKSTYVDALPAYLSPETGRLHTRFNQTVARTGRLSSSNPNLQNIPIGEEFGLRIRSAFVAEPRWRLISADYSQIELRILAHLSEDPLLVETFSRNEDIHARTAQEIFGVPEGLQTHEHRRMAKAVNYGVIYGLSSFGLAVRTGTSKSEAKEYIDAYFARYRRVKEYLDGLLEEARGTGRVRTLFGRLRPIPEIKSPDPTARGRAEREALNTPLQGTAADLMKLAMVKLHARLRRPGPDGTGRREKLRTRIILTVHDELVLETPEEELDAAKTLVKAEMEGAYLMKVPLRVDVGVGKDWKEAKA